MCVEMRETAKRENDCVCKCERVSVCGCTWVCVWERERIVAMFRFLQVTYNERPNWKHNVWKNYFLCNTLMGPTDREREKERMKWRAIRESDTNLWGKSFWLTDGSFYNVQREKNKILCKRIVKTANILLQTLFYTNM
jgi:hypothetical protein